jgi:hypothetical protein
MATLSRRTLLAAGAGALIAAACGSKGASSGDGGGGGPTALVARFEDGVFIPGAQRVAVSLGNTTGLVSDNLPAALAGKVTTVDGMVVVPQVSADRHQQGLPLPYYPFPLQLQDTGTYQLVVDVGGKSLTQAFTVANPSTVLIPKVGEKLPPFDTPTTANGRGVNPICTKQPPCPLHNVTLTDALKTGKPVAYLIGTPAFCQTGVCGPILDFVVAAQQRVGDKAVMVHAEVYTDNTAKTTTPAVDAYHMSFEPCLWITDTSGTIVERLDFVFDQGEIDTALTKAGVS